jgi:hypothetical protein
MLADAARRSAVLHLSHPAHRGSVLAIGPVVAVDARHGAPDARRLRARHRHACASRRGVARRRTPGGLSVRRRRDAEAHRSTKQLSSADAALQGSRRLRNVGGDARVPPANLTRIPRRSSVHRRDSTEDRYRTPLETRTPGLASSCRPLFGCERLMPGNAQYRWPNRVGVRHCSDTQKIEARYTGC